ncbi:hypothetical protein Pcinc_025538 [Petrolisthes cinctipes]|uniref:PPIase cyclophilin-type domain-containing protein n=1 Tax=Petrolisthes cinctipes TaxID=88211 RepID=A0AAE1KBS6_PETCI|nr:hypothetical protein Pcinc_025538 [Petrolisthes cinctipes]
MPGHMALPMPLQPDIDEYYMDELEINSLLINNLKIKLFFTHLLNIDQQQNKKQERKNQPPPHVAITLPVSEIIKTLNPESTITFLDMAWEGLTRGRVYIRVSVDITEARQFVGLCTGQPGSSFLNTRLNRVLYKGGQNECVFGGNYNFNDCIGFGTDDDVGRVTFKSNSEKSGQFCINTNNGYGYLGAVIGRVESGLEVLKAAAQLNDITQVTVVDCGVVVPL